MSVRKCLATVVGVAWLLVGGGQLQGALFRGLGFLPGGYHSAAWGVSADGSTVVGYSRSEMFRWTQATGMVGLGDLPGGGFDSMAFDVSSDGSVVVGYGIPPYGYVEAVRWTEATGMVGLGDLPEGYFQSIAWGVSADGSVVVGNGTINNMGWPSGNQAFRWTQAGGMVALGYLPGTSSSTAWAVSADGSVVVGDSDLVPFRWTQGGGMVALAHVQC